MLRGEAGREPWVQTGLEFYEIQEVAGPDRGMLYPRFTACALDLGPFTVLCKFKIQGRFLSGSGRKRKKYRHTMS